MTGLPSSSAAEQALIFAQAASYGNEPRPEKAPRPIHLGSHRKPIPKARQFYNHTRRLPGRAPWAASGSHWCPRRAPIRLAKEFPEGPGLASPLAGSSLSANSLADHATLRLTSPSVWSVITCQRALACNSARGTGDSARDRDHGQNRRQLHRVSTTDRVAADQASKPSEKPSPSLPSIKTTQ